MKIEQLDFENFKGIDESVIELNCQSAVFFGNNGAGKTTVLSAAAILLSRIVENATKKSYKKLVINSAEIKNGKQRLIIKGQFNFDDTIGDLTLIKSRAKNVTSNSTLKPIDNSLGIVKKLNNYLNMNNKKNIPVLIYYPVERAVLDSTLHIKDKVDISQISIYKNSFAGGADFKSFFEWYKAQEDLENEIRLSDELNYEDKMLKAVREAIYNFMPGFTEMRITRKSNKPSLTIKKRGIRLEISQLSHGEKTTLAMIGDLARRLAIANPCLNNPLDGSGIVIIDEIELHLHPSWQRSVLNKLYAVFKNIQFLISTHSPQVIGEVNKGKLFLMEHSERVEKERVIFEVVAKEQSLQFGLDSNLILSALMNADEKNISVKELEEVIFENIESGNLNVAKESLNYLISELLGKSTSSTEKLKALLKRKEFLGE